MTGISVVMPLYNAREFLEESLECVLKQTFTEFELICVNDASSDDTLKILKEFQKKDSRIVILENENRMGAAYSRNLGIETAIGKYIMFLDGDDVFDEKMLELSYICAESNNADIVMFDYKHVNSDNIHKKRMSYHSPEYNEKYCKRTFAVKKQSPYDWARWTGAPCNKLFKKEFICENEIEFQSLASSNDVYFVFLALLLSQRTIVLDDFRVMVYARDHNTETRISFNRDPMCAYMAIEHLQETLLKRNLFTEYYQHFYYWAFFQLRGTLERTKNDNVKEKFYLFLQQRGIECLICNGELLYNKLDTDIKEWFQEFVKCDFQTRWFEKKTPLFFYLRDKEETVKTLFQKYENQRMKIAVWGAGRNGYSFLEFCKRKQLKVDVVIDYDKNKQGSSLFGVPIRAYENVCNDIQVIIVSALNIYNDVKKMVQGKNIEVIDINFLMDCE